MSKRVPTSFRLVATAAVAAGMALASAGADAAQQARPQYGALEPGQQLTEQEVITPQFGGSVGRVLVDVTVHDDDGNFVSDLTVADFEVLEEGKPVDIEFFALERFRRDFPMPGIKPDEAPPVAPEIAEAPVLPRYMVLFIDGFNTSPIDWERVRFALNDYLDNQLQDDDLILLATLTPRRKLLVAPEFTRDVESLKRALAELTTNPSIRERERQNQQDLLRVLYEDPLGLTTVGGGAFDAEEVAAQDANVLRQGASMAQVFAGQRKDEILYTINSMTSLAAHLNRTFDVPGPKTMIMVSAGISQTPGSEYYYILDSRLDQSSQRARMDAPAAAEHPIAFQSMFARTIEGYLMRAIGRLNRLNYTLYTIGARGTAIGMMPSGETARRSNLSPGTASLAFRDQQEGLRMLSAGTGGLAFDNSLNFGEAFNRIDRDTAFRYVLGYTPPPRGPNDKPDKFYRIRVKVGRDDINVRSRRGYINN